MKKYWKNKFGCTKFPFFYFNNWETYNQRSHLQTLAVGSKENCILLDSVLINIKEINSLLYSILCKVKIRTHKSQVNTAKVRL